MKGVGLPNTRPALTFAGCRAATLEDVRAGSLVFAGVGGEPTDGAGATRIHGSAASAVRAASDDLLRSYRESPSGTAVDLETGRKMRLRTPGSCIDLGQLEPSGAGHRGGVCAALGRQIAEKGARPLMVGGGDPEVRGLIDGIRGVYPASGIVEISDRCLGSSLGFAGPILSLGVSGLQDAGTWRRQIANGGRVVTAEALRDAGPDAARDGLPDYSVGGAGPICILDCRAIDIGYAAGSDSFTVAGLTPEQFVAVATSVGVFLPPSAATVIHLEPSRDPRGHMESLVAEALLGLFCDTLFEETGP